MSGAAGLRGQPGQGNVAAWQRGSLGYLGTQSIFTEQMLSSGAPFACSKHLSNVSQRLQPLASCLQEG